MIGKSAPKPKEPAIKRSTQQDEILTIDRDETVFRIVATEEAGKLTILVHIINSSLMMGASAHFRPTTDEAMALRDFLTEMLP